MLLIIIHLALETIKELYSFPFSPSENEEKLSSEQPREVTVGLRVEFIECQDTLKPPPLENKTMKAASMIAVFIITFFYLLCGSLGYAAFGDSTPGNLLTDVGFYEPYWLLDLANVCIIMYLVGGYQVTS